ncbi:hypothetical protein GIB67_000087 [Kingdonia uniflora]|uniref:non-specific serine/threonine protein kinase n=1 Tax=Kingdonia uniflora TaxID=39325 RepID=A0A7J7M5S1_9MAGN|nr:hypothetical protein GIB67_000087 [Kingdonia uniflora]
MGPSRRSIKVMEKEKILKGGLIAHIKREISILCRVQHPNIVQPFEVMATKTKIYFLMEYVKGGELFNRVAKGRLKEVARKYFQQLISAVEFCHTKGAYHRGLKPENLLVDENGDLKDSDFGLSCVSDQIWKDGLFYTFCGTTALEVLVRKGYDAAKVDIWSCGVILFVLMAGYLPFHDHNILLMYMKIYHGEFRCPSWFSLELTRLLIRVLDMNPTTRIPISEIMENKWFKKGFKHMKLYIENDKFYNEEDDDIELAYHSEASVSESDSEHGCHSQRSSLDLPRPSCLNALDIISFSQGFDPSGLLEERGEESRFICDAPVSKIISKLEEIAKVVSFKMRKKDCRVSLEGQPREVRGPLTIGAEIFELTPKLQVVELRKKGGDIEEFKAFCKRELKPVFENLVVDDSVVVSNLPSGAAIK